jgi:hypothetical protein
MATPPGWLFVALKEYWCRSRYPPAGAVSQSSNGTVDQQAQAVVLPTLAGGISNGSAWSLLPQS